MKKTIIEKSTYDDYIKSEQERRDRQTIKYVEVVK